MKTTPQRPSTPSPTPLPPQQRESADEKMMKALLNRAMKDVLAKQDKTLLSVAQAMVNTGQMREKVPQRNLSDDELRSMLHKRPATDENRQNPESSDTI